MTNKDVIEELVTAARFSEHEIVDIDNRAARIIVTAVISRLAEIGASEEMLEAGLHAPIDGYVYSVSGASVFTAMLRALAKKE